MNYANELQMSEGIVLDAKEFLKQAGYAMAADMAGDIATSCDPSSSAVDPNHFDNEVRKFLQSIWIDNMDSRDAMMNITPANITVLVARAADIIERCAGVNYFDRTNDVDQCRKNIIEQLNG